MILVDTSIWIDHLRSGSPALVTLLQGDAFCAHDFVIGELACGNLRNRMEVLGLLQSLPRLSAATEEETLFFIEQQQLRTRGQCHTNFQQSLLRRGDGGGGWLGGWLERFRMSGRGGGRLAGASGCGG